MGAVGQERKSERVKTTTGKLEKMKLGPYDLDTIHCGECSEMMAALPDDCIDLTVTSPPYDNLRDYHGFVFDFDAIAAQLWRVTKVGGVVGWVVGDATVNGSETGSSFRQALWFMELGFRLHDTMIYQTNKPPLTQNRYEQTFEYMFVFSKEKPVAVNLLKIPAYYAGQKRTATMRQDSDELNNRSARGNVGTDKSKTNIWYLPRGGGNHSNLSVRHPATFPEALAHDHIISWSNPGDVVLDPFIGSGTTAKMAKQLGRRWLGFDISQEYVELARKRVQQAQVPLFVPEITKVAEPEQVEMNL